MQNKGTETQSVQKTFQIDSSHDSLVFLIEQESSWKINNKFADNTKTILQTLEPLASRFSEEEVLLAANKYVNTTNFLGAFGVQKYIEKFLGEVGFLVAENCLIKDNPLTIASPFIPGPKLSSILDYPYLPTSELAYLSAVERIEILRLPVSSYAFKSKLKGALYNIEQVLKQTSEIVTFDPYNVKLRWDVENEIPVFVITDIQTHIGQGVIF